MQVRDNPDRSRFELPLEDGDIAIVDYRIDGDRVLLTHAEVPRAYEGRGIGSQLARGVFERIRADGRLAVPLCSFMAAYARRHPEYADIVTPA